jgi:RimJ/RimL family protein N-acetyltransferase
LEFRAAEPADVPAIAQLLLRASPGRTLEHELGYVGAYFEQRETRIQIALDDGTMVGIVSFEPSLIRGEEIAGERLAYLRLIAVDPARWGSGLATELLCSAAGEMRDAGYAEAYLWCGESNARAALLRARGLARGRSGACPRRLGPDAGLHARPTLRGVSTTVILEPWGDGDLPLLERLMGDPGMTVHLGGPEDPEKLRERQGRYERLGGNDRMFKIVDENGAGVGSVGYWTKDWRDTRVYEIGWMVVPEFQGQGIAVDATGQAIELAKRDDAHRWMHAFPNIENAASNAICRKLGFELLEACEFEFPKGHFMTCNDWRLDLRA